MSHVMELLHKAYLRLVLVEVPQRWNGRGRFFAAAAEAMRRIIVARVRSKRRLRRDGEAGRIELDDHHAALGDRTEQILAIDEALANLQGHDPLSRGVEGQNPTVRVDRGAIGRH